ncbi:peptidoglycan editing factor PgeF [Candidatus Oleimmundimicrobium sp.]|uniref:peptidoglycan editing factor PgeF n=1 Tax=Candidatus Oleimmundimicrobium sp. TaxID=3060597 RepID=UPI002723F4F4|nr:peptidoglycan editing factor PgeF [Candidatus Oleimmundimicrobium sp.]MDO8885514.1 peptidoglycan editing factor PgeF [Candidatus Oleimmundimicrobium sp.]
MPSLNLERVEKGKFVFFTSKELFQKSDILIAFTTRLKGASSPPYKSLNLAFHVGDKKERVIQNRKILCSVLNLDFPRLTACEQVHGNNLVVVDKSLIGRGAFSHHNAISNTDALITNQTKVPLAIFCADCVPIIIVDPTKRIVSVVHAGWRGSYAEIAKKTVQMFVDKFHSLPQSLFSFIGPCIGDCCYRVDSTLAQEFEEKFALHLDTRQGESYLNLVEININQLLKSGIKSGNIYCSNICTSCDSDFFSHRRENGVTGRQSALVAVF